MPRSQPSRPAGVRFVAIALITLLLPLAAATTAPQASAATTPSLRLVAASAEAQIHIARSGNYEVHFPFFVASSDGAFELWAQRIDTYDEPVTLSQIVRNGTGEVTDTLPITGVPEPLLSRGLPQFVTAELKRRSGTILADATRPFCPNSYSQQRLDDSGPANPSYPPGCWATPFTRGGVWGIAQGWATRARVGLGRTLDVADGKYRLTVSIAEPYRSALGMAVEDSTITVPATVMSGATTVHARTKQQKDQNATAPVAEATSFPITTPPNSALPDIEALPAWGMRVENGKRSGRSFLNFGATAWNAGPGSLVVEGFRDPSSELMDAFQYFYEDGELVGKLPAGRLEYDNRDGHDHWHFRDFAAYSLLDENQVKVLDSGKEAFCLAPTDPIDLTIEGAEWNPWLTDLSTACGEEGSLWIREVLQAGWGDTYAQYRPGQSFEITDLPNGTYFVKVLANPDNVLAETTADNNVALRQIELRGKAGDRRVVVPPYGLIDSEGADCGFFC